MVVRFLQYLSILLVLRPYGNILDSLDLVKNLTE